MFLSGIIRILHKETTLMNYLWTYLSNDRYNLSLMIRENKWSDFKTKHINKWFTERGRSTIEKWSMLNMLFFLFLCLSFPLFVSFSFPLSLLHPPPLLLFYFLTLPLWTYMTQTKSFHGWNSMEPFCLYSLSLDNCVPLIEQCSLAATLWL